MAGSPLQCCILWGVSSAGKVLLVGIVVWDLSLYLENDKLPNQQSEANLNGPNFRATAQTTDADSPIEQQWR